jgi:outer membrane protein OmpA-like peptidoglycan-associated protein
VRAAALAGVVVGLGLLAAATMSVRAEVRAASSRLEKGLTLAAKPEVAVADDAEVGYCTADFKKVLARVIHACGLAGAEGRRGCQPADVKTLASISDDEFNALFTPLEERGAVLMFDDAAESLDEAAKKLLDERWQERKGARYFFVVARASRTGTVDFNRKLSHKRANSVMFHLSETHKDPELDKKVGLLWLGKEFAQLGKEYCAWRVSRPDRCDADAINRSAFVSWVDCRL